jgi:hypothetical protein
VACTSVRPAISLLRAPQNGLMTRQIFPYRLDHDDSFCAVRMFILPPMSTLKKPCSAANRFLREIDTRLASRSIMYQMTSILRPHSVLSSATDVGPSRLTQISRVRRRSSVTSDAMHTPTISSTYMIVELVRACRSSHCIALVTTWKAAGVPAHPKIPASCRYTTLSVSIMAKSSISSGRNDSRVYASRRSIFHSRRFRQSAALTLA